jgi:hypothetical protein
MNKTHLIAAALLLALPIASAQTYADPAGDATPDRASLDILSVSVDSDGSDLIVVFGLDDVQANQPATRYSFHVDDQDGAEISIDCYLGFGFIQLESQTCAASHEAIDGPAVGTFEEIASTSAFDLTADTIAVHVPYTEFGGASGDVVQATLGASARLVADHIPVLADTIGVNDDVTLA